jgi:uncharacterized protein involved in exopolysaccharide biosynthesis
VNPRYRETFNRHRLLFAMPVLWTLVIALWAGFGTQKLYRSNTTLWSESTGEAASAALGAPTPAMQDQAMLAELLKTSFFANNVARRSPLLKYLRNHAYSGRGPSVVLKQLMHGTPSMEDRIAAALSPKRVTSTVEGNHVLDVSLDAPTAPLAQATLRELVREFRQQRAVLAKDALSTAQSQVSAATNALGEARLNLNKYLTAHPGSTTADPELRSLAAAERNAVRQLGTASQSMNQASAAVLNGSGLATSLRVLDPPRYPTGPTAGKKKLLKTLVIGLIAGALLSFLAVVLATKLIRPPRENEAEGPHEASMNGAEPRPADAEPVPSEAPAEAPAGSHLPVE